MDAAIAELKEVIDALKVKVEDFLAANAVDIQNKIDEAIALDDAGEAVDLAVLKEDVMAIANRIPPVFEESGN